MRVSGEAVDERFAGGTVSDVLGRDIHGGTYVPVQARQRSSNSTEEPMSRVFCFPGRHECSKLADFWFKNVPVSFCWGKINVVAY